MAKIKKPENETAEEATIRNAKETVANHAPRNEKVSWNRKMDNMVKELSLLDPIEEQITELLAQKSKILDRVQALRYDMVKDCIHPFTHLVYHQDHIVCKFCNRKFSVQE